MCVTSPQLLLWAELEKVPNLESEFIKDHQYFASGFEAVVRSIEAEIWFDYAFQFAVMLSAVPPLSIPRTAPEACREEPFAVNAKNSS